MRFEVCLTRILGTALIIASTICPLSIVADEGQSTRKSASEVSSQFYQHKEPGLEFTIQVPPLWLVEAGMAGYAAALKPSAKAQRLKLPGRIVADPTITIAASRKPVKFDAESLDKNASDIEEKFIKANGRGTDFQIFQRNIVNDLPDGNKGLLYYVSYKTDGVEVGQAILITGHEGARFRVTLSDHRMNFDRNLELYYPFMTSIKFQARPSAEKNSNFAGDFALWGVGVVLSGVVVGLIARNRRSRLGTSTVRRKPASRASRNHSVTELNSQVSQLPTNVSSAFGQELSESDAQLSEAPNVSAAPYTEASLSSFAPGGDAVEPAFSVNDLSAPPQSIPLSQVVDENSAPPSLKKQWQIASNPGDEQPANSNSEKNRRRD